MPALGGGTATKTVPQAPTPAATTPNAPASEDGSAKAGRCGVERWAVKTLQDPGAGQVNPTPKLTTIAALRMAPAPSNPTDRVAPGPEVVTWHLTSVQLGAFKQEADGDVHLVVGPPGGTMIVEFPRAGCYPLTAPAAAKEIAAARKAVEAACGQPGPSYVQCRTRTATVEGPGFFDRRHGQRGVAPNGIEIHPALAFMP